MYTYCINPSKLPQILYKASRHVAKSLEKEHSVLPFLLDLFTYGLAMFIDDIHDFGKIDRIHHYIVGLLFMLASLGGLKYFFHDVVFKDLEKYLKQDKK